MSRANHHSRAGGNLVAGRQHRGPLPRLPRPLHNPFRHSRESGNPGRPLRHSRAGGNLVAGRPAPRPGVLSEVVDPLPASLPSAGERPASERGVLPAADPNGSLSLPASSRLRERLREVSPVSPFRPLSRLRERLREVSPVSPFRPLSRLRERLREVPPVPFRPLSRLRGRVREGAPQASASSTLNSYAWRRRLALRGRIGVFCPLLADKRGRRPGERKRRTYRDKTRPRARTYRQLSAQRAADRQREGKNAEGQSHRRTYSCVRPHGARLCLRRKRPNANAHPGGAYGYPDPGAPDGYAHAASAGRHASANADAPPNADAAAHA